MPSLTEREREFALNLRRLGAPLVTMTANPHFQDDCKTDRRGPAKEYFFPADWSSKLAEGSEACVDEYDGQGAIAAVVGGRIAFVDVDSSDETVVANVREKLANLGLEIFAEDASPRGGAHFWVAGHPDIPNVPAGTLAGWESVEVFGNPHLAYLPGTRRPKYNGLGYRIVFDELQALDKLEPEEAERQGERLAQWIAESRLVRGRQADAIAAEWTYEIAPVWDQSRPQSDRERNYLASALSRQSTELSAAPEGTRNDALFVAALKMGSYIAGAGLSADAVVDALLAACVANGLSRSDGDAQCRATINSGLRLGAKRPKTVPPKDETVAQQIVRLALEEYRFGQSTEGRAFAVRHVGPNVARELSNGNSQFQQELAGLLYDRTGKVPSNTALSDARNVLTARARRGEREDLALRVAQPEPDRIIIDMGNEVGQAIEVTPRGWTLLSRSPVLFRRTAFTTAFPVPDESGSVAALGTLINVASDAFDLIVAWLVSAFFPGIPHPMLLIAGEQGSAKSTATFILSRLVDPSATKGRGMYTTPERWLDFAASTYALVVDNVTKIDPWLSDALCRAISEEGTGKRGLYTDDAMHLAQFRRVVLMNGISPTGIRGDLQDRTLPVDLKRIDPSARKEDAQVEADFRQAWPTIFGGILKALVQVLRIRAEFPRRDSVDKPPRMADFARILAALDLTNGTTSLDTYLDLLEDAKASLALDHPLATAMARAIHLASDDGESFEGTASEWFAMLSFDDARRKPGTARVMKQWLTEIAPGLREAGWTIEFRKSNGRKLIYVKVASADQ